MSALVLGLVERPLIGRLSRTVEARGWGLLPRLPGPPALKGVLGVLLLDYTLYWWHVLLHRSRLLWRLHLPHHADLDLDASTALRFHFSELLASIPWRAGQAVLIGAGPRLLDAWQTLTLACVLFHHSNLRLPWSVERRLSRVLTTPRMHGIHHSTIQDETNSNWSSGLSLWDRLHGTFRLDIPQSAIQVGVPAYRRPEDLGFAEVLTLPFRPQRPAWRDEQGRHPVRTADLGIAMEPT